MLVQVPLLFILKRGVFMASYNDYSGIKLEDLYRLQDNKKKWGETTDPALKAKYNAENNAIRASYSLGNDRDVSRGVLNDYIDRAEKYRTKNKLLSKITESSPKRSDATAEEIRNFGKNYNVYDDDTYKAYSDMYQRNGASAAKSTLNQLNAASGGRNNSYSSAATAQVQQAYAQKVSEMIPTITEQAYNRLLQRYNIEKNADDTDFNRNIQGYQAVSGDISQNLSDENIGLSNDAQKVQNRYLEAQLKQALESGELQNEYQRIMNSVGNETLAQQRIATLIQQKYGLSSAEADYQAQIIANSISNVQLQSYRNQLGFSSKSAGKRSSGGSGKTSYSDVLSVTYDAPHTEISDKITESQLAKGKSPKTASSAAPQKSRSAGTKQWVRVSGLGRVSEDEYISLLEKGKIGVDSNGINYYIK